MCGKLCFDICQGGDKYFGRNSHKSRNHGGVEIYQHDVLHF